MLVLKEGISGEGYWGGYWRRGRGGNYLEVERANKGFFVRIKSLVTLSDRVLVFGIALNRGGVDGISRIETFILGTHHM